MKLATTKQATAGKAFPGVIGEAPLEPGAAAWEELTATLVLDERGMICDCHGACEALFDYGSSELLGRHVCLLLPQLADMELLQDGQPNPRLRYLCRVGQQFEAQRKDGARFDSEIFLNLLAAKDRGCLSLIVRPAASRTDEVETAPGRLRRRQRRE